MAANGGLCSPVEVAHDLVAQKGLAPPRQTDQNDDQLLPVHPIPLPNLPRPLPTEKCTASGRCCECLSLMHQDLSLCRA